MANPTCPRCNGRTVLDSRNPKTWSCRDCGHQFVDEADTAW